MGRYHAKMGWLTEEVMDKSHCAMIDMVFELKGDALPTSYPFALWDELVRYAPQLANDDLAGIIPLRTVQSGENMLLPKRAKLAIRLPQAQAEIITVLTGRELNISGNKLRLGACQPRPIQSHSTLHAQLVIGTDDEAGFLKEIQADLDAMNIQGRLICGKRQTLSDNSHTLIGHSLVIYDLAPSASLHLQCAGLGAGRRFGCGIFVPYKIISGLQ